MNQNRLITVTIVNWICLISIMSLYLTKKNNIIEYLFLITIVSILVYKFNDKLSEKNKINYKHSIMNNKHSYILKKRYLFWSATFIYYCYSTINRILFSFSDSKNQKAVETYLDKKSILEAEINVGILTPIVEEIIFRGLLLMVISGIGLIIAYNFKKEDSLKIQKGATISFVIISTILFGFAHVASGDYSKILPYLISGFVFSFSYVITKTLYLPILIHMIGNTFSTMSYYDDSIAYWLQVLMIVYICIGLFWWSQKRNSVFNKKINTLEKKNSDLDLTLRKRMKLILGEACKYTKNEMFLKEEVNGKSSFKFNR